MFLKSTVLPWESVILPSSNTCNNTLNTSGWAFSISSKSTTEYGFLRTASVSWPPSSYPTYPGGAPINLDTEYFSIYSLISIRTIFVSSSNKFCASALASSVLPTPVGPKNRNEPIGLPGSFIPAFDLIIDSVIFVTASSCPITRLCNCSSKWRVLFLSVSVSLATGIPVQREMIFAISSSVTLSRTKDKSLFFTFASSLSNCFCNWGNLPYCNSAIFSRSYLLWAICISFLTCSTCSRSSCNLFTEFFSFSHWAFLLLNASLSSANSFWSSSNLSLLKLSVSFFKAASSISICITFLLSSSSSVGIESSSVFIIAQASSTRSIALSGKNLSVI